MFGWFKFKPPLVKSEPPLPSKKSIESSSLAKALDGYKKVWGEGIMTDPQALAMIEEFRVRFSSAPIGVWDDCVDSYFGMGFAGVTGHSSRATFTQDGKGQCIGENETVHFIWQSVSDRVIDVRCVERIPPLENWTSEEIEEDQQWHRVEYDFVVPQYVNVPVIFDVEDRNRAKILDGTVKPSEFWFLQCFSCLWVGPLKLSHEAVV